MKCCGVPKSDYPNIIFIVVDSLRKDFAKPLEAELKKLGFTSYENVIAPAPWTVPSHASIFTGLYPAFHGAHETRTRKGVAVKLQKSSGILSDYLDNLGYRTYLLSANPYIRPEFGFSKFDHFYGVSYTPVPLTEKLLKLSDDESRVVEELKKRMLKFKISKIKLAEELMFRKRCKLLKKLSLRYLYHKLGLHRLYLYTFAVYRKWPLDKGASELVNRLASLLKNAPKNEPKFIFMNLMEVHEPYTLNEIFNKEHIGRKNLKTNTLDQKIVKKWRENYSMAVAYVTKKILEVMQILREHGMFDNSLIIVTSDHGQLLGEHGRVWHGTFLYDELLRVPLLVKYPSWIKVEHVQEDTKYISLARLKRFILEVIDNSIDTDGILYEDTVYAESYGIPVDIGEPLSEEERRNIGYLEKYRVAVYHKSFKALFNVSDWKFEEIVSYDPKLDISEDIVKILKNEIMKLLRITTSIKALKLGT